LIDRLANEIRDGADERAVPALFPALTELPTTVALARSAACNAFLEAKR
jgi:hypothetical protein